MKLSTGNICLSNYFNFYNDSDSQSSLHVFVINFPTFHWIVILFEHYSGYEKQILFSEHRVQRKTPVSTYDSLNPSSSPIKPSGRRRRRRRSDCVSANLFNDGERNLFSVLWPHIQQKEIFRRFWKVQGKAASIFSNPQFSLNISVC